MTKEPQSETAHPIHQGDALRADLFDRGNSRLMVTFDFRRSGRGPGFVPFNASQQFARNGFDQLVIRSRLNDWFINAETRSLEAALRELSARYARVHALGYSMGGYGAFRFAPALNASRVVAVSPQYSIAPGEVPWDPRYRADAGGFDPELGALSGGSDLSGMILVDPLRPLDLRHGKRLSRLYPGLGLLRLAGAGHPATGVLRDSGRAWMVHRAAMMEEAPGRDLRSFHRAGRKGSATYWTELARAAERLGRERLASTALDRAEELDQG